MSLIGLELIDAGIMAAGSTTEKLLQIDGQAYESPGFALPDKDGLLVGKAAENRLQSPGPHLAANSTARR
jgi:hypothetical protein